MVLIQFSDHEGNPEARGGQSADFNNDGDFNDPGETYTAEMYWNKFFSSGEWVDDYHPCYERTLEDPPGDDSQW